MITNLQELQEALKKEVAEVEVIDVHTHLFPEGSSTLLLWGIDEVLTYHYLVAEFFRYSEISYYEFYTLPKNIQADLIWEKLFINRSPVSEAQRGVLTIFKKMGLSVSSRDLNKYREHWESLAVGEQIDTVFKLANLKEVVMTNDPFDATEREFWEKGLGKQDRRFKAALRIDPLLMDYPNSYKELQAQGYDAKPDLSGDSLKEIRRFLKDWAVKMDALYLAVSLPPDFNLRENNVRTKIVEHCVLPVCLELNIPFSPMIGVKKLINPGLQLAGDSLGKSEIEVIEYLCSTYPENKFFVTMLSLENQHELAITARKYGNLMVFGCWWFLNNPSVVEKMTRIRMETLGLSFIPQHSDARVLEHLIYKWDHSKKIIEKVLFEKYSDILATGWTIKQEEIRRDLEYLFQTNFMDFLNK